MNEGWENTLSRPIRESLDSMRAKYEEEIKPLIEGGEYLLAHYEMENIIMYWEERHTELCLKVHSGIGYFASARCLSDALRTASEIPELQIRRFEAMQAQTSLPLIIDERTGRIV